jgi:hypothetical protein
LESFRSLYNRALREAEDLHIAFAYLMEWDPSWKLGSKCRKVLFVVGRDFALSQDTVFRRFLVAWGGIVIHNEEKIFLTRFLPFIYKRGRKCMMPIGHESKFRLEEI